MPGPHPPEQLVHTGHITPNTYVDITPETDPLGASMRSVSGCERHATAAPKPGQRCGTFQVGLVRTSGSRTSSGSPTPDSGTDNRLRRERKSPHRRRSRRQGAFRRRITYCPGSCRGPWGAGCSPVRGESVSGDWFSLVVVDHCVLPTVATSWWHGPCGVGFPRLRSGSS